MCGICGKLSLDGQGSISSEVLRRMTNVIAHRGPDDSGHYLSGPVGLGHRRLSIIDLTTGHQPISNEDGSVWVVFNGEIYNFEALRKELVACGHQFRSTSDTEVIVHLYEELGESCVERLRGMFAFALWDQRHQRLLLARDRIGIKPLYYARTGSMSTGSSLVFGSEMKSILADPSVPRNLDLAAVDRFLTYYYVPGDLTPIQGIRKLLPGHCLVAEQGHVRTRQYWDLSFPDRPRDISLGEAAEELGSLLRETFDDHMMSDVPVGILLSGGVDSTGMLHFAAQHARGELYSFTLGFADDHVPDERPYARLAAQHFGSRHQETTISAAQFRDFLPSYVWHMEEPVCEPPAISLYFVARLARDQGVKVLLSGEGGDEAFGGYPEYRNLAALEALKAWTGPAKGLLDVGFGALARLGWERGRHYQGLVRPALCDYYFSRTATPQTPFNRAKPGLYGPALRAQAREQRPELATRGLLEATAGQPLLNRMLYVDAKSWLPDDLLVKADKMTMAASVELRVPLLDHRVLELAASLPTRHKLLGWSQKRVLKRVLAPTIPAAILNRKKAGFPVPYERWIRQDLRDYVHDHLLSAGGFSSRYLDRRAVAGLLETQRCGCGCSKEVFSLLVLELWHQQFITQSMAPMPARTAVAAPSSTHASDPMLALENAI